MVIRVENESRSKKSKYDKKSMKVEQRNSLLTKEERNESTISQTVRQFRGENFSETSHQTAPPLYRLRISQPCHWDRINRDCVIVFHIDRSTCVTNIYCIRTRIFVPTSSDLVFFEEMYQFDL